MTDMELIPKMYKQLRQLNHKKKEKKKAEDLPILSCSTMHSALAHALIAWSSLHFSHL